MRKDKPKVGERIRFESAWGEHSRTGEEAEVIRHQEGTKVTIRFDDGDEIEVETEECLPIRKFLSEIGCYVVEGIRLVLVFPPPERNPTKGWWVVVPSTRRSEPLIGEDVEQRAFGIAELYSQQRD